MDIRQCYKILDLSPGATAAEIRRQHRDLASVWHPDRFGDNPRLRQKAERKLARINAAFDAVMDHVAAGGDGCGFGTDDGPADAGSDDRFRPPPGGWAACRPRSVFKRLMAWLMLASAIGTGYLVYTRLDTLTRLIRQPAADLDRQMNQALKLPAIAPVKPPVPAAAPRPPRPKKFVEIQLKNGDIIIARSFRIKGDMVVYRTSAGTVGIQRSNVAAIRVCDPDAPGD